MTAPDPILDPWQALQDDLSYRIGTQGAADVVARFRPLVERDDLGAAWAAAETAGEATNCPGILALRHHSEADGDYRATWYRPVDATGGGTVVAGTGDTPIAALRALAGRLSQPDAGTEGETQPRDAE